MKKIISLLLGSIVAFALSMSAAFSAANQVRVAFFLEWATPNQEAKVKKVFDDALGVPVKWTNFATGGEMTEAMLSGDIDISYSQGLTPFVNAVNAKAPLKLVDIAVVYGMGGTTCVAAQGIDKGNASTKLDGQKVAVPLGTMADYVSHIIQLLLLMMVMLGPQNIRIMVHGFTKPHQMQIHHIYSLMDLVDLKSIIRQMEALL